MESKQLKLIFQTLDDVRHQNGQEYWYARELFPCLGYSKWENFLPVIQKAKEACRNSGSSTDDHFLDVQKMVTLGSVATEKYLISNSQDMHLILLLLMEIQENKRLHSLGYFVTQTRKFELMEKRMEELERLDAREKLKITEKEFGALAFARGVDGKGIALIRSRGDEELFGKKKTEDMKKRLGVSNDKPLADVLPTVTLKAKDLATAMTTENARKKNLYGLVPIGKEHVANNQSIREALVKSDIYPENLPAGENIKAIEARHRKELKALQIKQKKELEQAQKKIKGK